MKKYIVYSLLSTPSQETERLFEKSFSSLCSSLRLYKYLVGSYSLACPNSSVVSFDSSYDCPYISKTLISSGDSLIYLYLEKLL